MFSCDNNNQVYNHHDSVLNSILVCKMFRFSLHHLLEGLGFYILNFCSSVCDVEPEQYGLFESL
jgi:hypothetical protein